MRNKSKLEVIILVVGFIFTLSTYSKWTYIDMQLNNDVAIEFRNEHDLKTPKSSGYWTTNFIYIDGNWSYTVGNYSWCSGDGSFSNPYTIENVTIDASSSPTGSGIFINNSKNEYFIIRNCTVYSSGSGSWDAGIRLENTNNGSLINNNCSNNDGHGILLYIGCNNNNIINNTVNNNKENGIYVEDNCYNNTISGNMANNNTWTGIFLHSNCRSNIISENTANNNTGNGIYLHTSCYNNIISENNINNNADTGIFLHSGCRYNIISENTANNNAQNGIYLVYCRDNIISENIVYNNTNSGIRLYNECFDNTISGNIANNNTQYGIALEQDCNDNNISGNTANNNTEYGIYLYTDCHKNTISGNTVNDNGEFGIYLMNNCDVNTIFENIASNNITTNQNHGIYLQDGCTINTISRNTVNGNIDFGIFLNNCDDNTISGNTARDNHQHGINLYFSSNNNTISGNTVNNNIDFGIWLNAFSGNNTIKENLIFENSVGIQLEWDCSNILLFHNYILNNSNYNGFDLGSNNWDNGVIGNYWGNYTSIDADYDGIGDTPYNVPGGAGNKDNYPIMIYKAFFFESPGDLTYEVGVEGHDIKWVVINPTMHSLAFNVFKDGSSIKTGQVFTMIKNEIVINVDGLDLGVYGYTLEVDDGNGGRFTDGLWVTVTNAAPIFTATPADFFYEVGETGNNLTWKFSDMSTNNPTYTISRNGVPIIINNPCVSGIPFEIPVDGLEVGFHGFTIEINDGYDGITLDSVWVTVSNTVPVFTATPADFSYEVGETGNNLTWTFSDVSTNNPTYTISRNSVPIIINNPCVSGVPIIIPVDGLEVGSHGFTIEVNDGYGETILDGVWITVNSIPEPDILNLLFVEIIDQSFSIEEFNITFSVYNGSGQGIFYTVIQLWWNEIDVSTDIQTLGNGLYFIALEPITVDPGEDPILLEIEISAPGYQDKYFNTYLAVDPDTLNKDLGGAPDNLPLVITITIITSIAAGVGVAGTTLFILRRRKQLS